MRSARAYQGVQEEYYRQVSVSAEDEAIGRLALRAVYQEAALHPKPGLVTSRSNGSHKDMTFSTFIRSIQSLRWYFPAIVGCGRRLPSFALLQQLGVRAEQHMLAATQGINTHRGAIFNLGLLCAAAGSLQTQGIPVSSAAACNEVAVRWGEEILSSTTSVSKGFESHGLAMTKCFGVDGARGQAGSGFQVAHKISLPVYKGVLKATQDPEKAGVQTMFALIASLDDTNLLWRGGAEGLNFAQDVSKRFMLSDSVFGTHWKQKVDEIDSIFRAKRLSPGGSADLLGVTIFLAGLDR